MNSKRKPNKNNISFVHKIKTSFNFKISVCKTKKKEKIKSKIQTIYNIKCIYASSPEKNKHIHRRIRAWEESRCDLNKNCSQSIVSGEMMKKERISLHCTSLSLIFIFLYISYVFSVDIVFNIIHQITQIRWDDRAQAQAHKEEWQRTKYRNPANNYATITNDEIFILSYLNEVMQYMCFLFNACKGRLRLTDDENTQLSCKYMPKRNNEATKKCTSTQKYMSAGQTVEPRHKMY